MKPSDAPFTRSLEMAKKSFAAANDYTKSAAHHLFYRLASNDDKNADSHFHHSHHFISPSSQSEIF